MSTVDNNDTSVQQLADLAGHDTASVSSVALQEPLTADEVLHELAIDKNGYPIADSFTGWKYSDRAMKARREKWARLLISKGPFSHERFREGNYKPRPGFEPPLLHFGFAFNTDQVITYIEHWKVPLPGGVTWAELSGPNHTQAKRASMLCVMIHKMRTHLSWLCGTWFEVVRPFSREYPAMIEIYNNYDMDTRVFVDPQDEIEIIEIITKELSRGEHKSEVGWWHSMKCARDLFDEPER